MASLLLLLATIIITSLSVTIVSIRAHGTKLSFITSVGRSVCLSVCLSEKSTVAKRLIGSGCRLGW